MDAARRRVIECTRTGERKKDDKTCLRILARWVTESRWEIGGGGGVVGEGGNLRCLSFLQLHSIIRANPRSDGPSKKKEKKESAEAKPLLQLVRRDFALLLLLPSFFCYSFRATDDNRERRTRRRKQHFDFRVRAE